MRCWEGEVGEWCRLYVSDDSKRPTRAGDRNRGVVPHVLKCKYEKSSVDFCLDVKENQ